MDASFIIYLLSNSMGVESTTGEKSSSRINNGLIYHVIDPTQSWLLPPYEHLASAKSCIVWRTWELNWSRNDRVTGSIMERETKAGCIKLLVVSGVEYCKVNPFRNDALNLGLNSLSDYFMHTYMIMIQYENTDIFVMIQYDSIQPHTEKLQAKIFFLYWFLAEGQAEFNSDWWFVYRFSQISEWVFQ